MDPATMKLIVSAVSSMAASKGKEKDKEKEKEEKPAIPEGLANILAARAQKK